MPGRVAAVSFAAVSMALAAACSGADEGSAEAPQTPSPSRCTYEPGDAQPTAGWTGVKALGWVVFAFAPAERNADLYVSHADGSSSRRLTDDPRSEFTPSWSPDGSRVVYRVEAVEEGTDADIWVVNADGRGRRNLTKTPRQAEWSPAWSPDGARIAYFSANEAGGDIYVMKPDGSGKTNVTRAKAPGANEYPTWSHDGEWIAFISYGLEGNFEISRIKADGSCRTNLTQNPVADTWPSWSPDGRKIAFVSDRDGSRELYTMNPDGSGVRRLTNTPKENENFPSWTADGHIAFVRERGNIYAVELWIVEADGSAPRRLQDAANFFTHMSWSGTARR